MSKDIIKLFGLFHQAGVTVLLATHDESLLQSFPYPQITLVHGKLDATAGVTQASRRRSATVAAE